MRGERGLTLSRRAECKATRKQRDIVRFGDVHEMRAVLFQTGRLEEDMNGDGRVNLLDFGLLKAQFSQPPGPSGVANVCD